MSQSLAPWISDFWRLRNVDAPFVLCTIVNIKGSSPRELGTRMFVGEREVVGTIGGGEFERRLVQDARDLLKTGNPRLLEYPLTNKIGQCCGGIVQVFVERIDPRPHLRIYGAGHVGQALSQVLDGLGFHIQLVDSRSEWLSHPNIPNSVEKISETWQSFNSAVHWDVNLSYAAVLTYSHDLDLEIVHDLVNRPIRYLGLIGSHTKALKFRSRLKSLGVNQDRIDRVKCPMGLSIGGGKAPKEIAISVAAEILSVFYGGDTSSSVSADQATCKENCQTNDCL